MSGAETDEDTLVAPRALDKRTARIEGVPMEGSLASRLWMDCTDLAYLHLHHPWSRGIGHGSLAKRAFQAHVGQDAHYLAAIVNCYTLMLPKANFTSRRASAAIKRLLDDCHEELSLHVFYAEDWEVDLDQEPASKATDAVAEYMLNVCEGPESLAMSMAAVWAGCRMWSFIAAQLWNANPAPKHAYAEWITTYCAAEHHATNERQEAIISSFGSQDNYEELLAVARKAMELSLQFITDLPELDPLPPVRVLVAGFNTCGVSLAGLSPEPSPRDALVDAHAAQTDALVEEFLANESARDYEEGPLLELCGRLAAANRKLVDDLRAAGLWSGLADAVFGSEQEVQPQVAAPLSRTCKEGVPLHVVAYKGAAAAVRLCLLAAQVPVSSNNIQQVAGSVGGQYSSPGYQRTAAVIHAPDTAGAAADAVSQPSWMEALEPPPVSVRRVSAAAAPAGRSVYIGAGLEDLDGLLAADLGILAANTDPRVRAVLRAAGARVKLLAAAPDEDSCAGTGVLFEARCWTEIEAYLFGSATEAESVRAGSQTSITAASLARVQRSDGMASRTVDYLLEEHSEEEGPQHSDGSGVSALDAEEIRKRIAEMSVKPS